jgi:hypothetical protein
MMKKSRSQKPGVRSQREKSGFRIQNPEEEKRIFNVASALYSDF